MADHKLSVRERTEFGKGASRRVRANNEVPAVLYGPDADPVHLILPGHETMLLVRNANALVELEVQGGESHLALVKEIQRHPVRRTLTHLDFLAVKRGQKVEVNVPMVITGDPMPPAIATVDELEITVSADVAALPEEITVSVEGLTDGTSILAGDLDLPEGVELVTEPDVVVVSVAHQREELPEDEAAEETEDEDTDTEGE